MPQLFPRAANTAARVFIVGVVLAVSATGWTAYTVWWSPYMTRVNVPLEQPAPFSHKHHVTELGIDCRYCHTGVETSAYAGLPPTETCMTCHSQIWRDAPMLEPVRASLREDRPLRWTRVNDLPDFVFFNHSIHVHQGIGCVECHGPIDKMAITWRGQSLYMKWCLDCHRVPEDHIRPRGLVFDTRPSGAVRAEDAGAELVRDYRVNTVQLADCSICHR
jgi:Cytochrome c7 and related cytochrome c